MGAAVWAPPFGPFGLIRYIRPIFDPSFEKKIGKVPGEGCVSKTWSFSSACKNWGGGAARPRDSTEIRSSEKCTLGGYNSTSRSPRLLDQISPDLFRLMREE